MGKWEGGGQGMKRWARRLDRGTERELRGLGETGAHTSPGEALKHGEAWAEAGWSREPPGRDWMEKPADWRQSDGEGSDWKERKQKKGLQRVQTGKHTGQYAAGAGVINVTEETGATIKR